ncbi:MAG: MoaD/ThiS family protein [Christensenellales bacterium]|jgi:sulfur carrier protein ThiS
MIEIEIFAPPVCSYDKIRDGKLRLNVNTTVKDVLKLIRLPALWRKLSVITVNNVKVNKDYILKDKDVLSIFMPVAGG